MFDEVQKFVAYLMDSVYVISVYLTTCYFCILHQYDNIMVHNCTPRCNNYQT